MEALKFNIETFNNEKKYLLAQEEASNMQDLIVFLERMIPNLDTLIDLYEEKNQ